MTVYDVLTIESPVDAHRQRIWSGTSEMTAPSNVAKASNELAAVLIAKMKADGVI